jgi:hypothetical protein
MVAHTDSIADRFMLAPEPVLSGRSHLVKFKRSDLPALVRLGIVPEDATTELLNGMIVLVDRAAEGEDILRVGRSHRITVERLSRLSNSIDTPLRHVECQQPLACGDTQEPQPDFMVVRGILNDLDDDYPTAADAYSVIEVADSSYERDLGEKLRGYARAGIQQYIIINLRNRKAEVYTNADAANGTYPPAVVLGERDSLPIRVGESEFFSVQLGQLLP